MQSSENAQSGNYYQNVDEKQHDFGTFLSKLQNDTENVKISLTQGFSVSASGLPRYSFRYFCGLKPLIFVKTVE